jgi:Protein of unknown function (DUF3052)
MGNEATCRVEIDAESATAKALLETEELIVRGALRAKIPFAEARDVRAEEGVLRLGWNGRDVRIHLGRDAAKWAEKIRNPKSIFDKLGVKAGQKISIAGPVDEDFVAQLEARGCDVAKKPRANSDLLFFAANAREDLKKLARLRESLAPNGALWVIRPKGSDAISEAEVMSAAKTAGLVDVKVAKFSATHTAEKLVIPAARR